VVLTLAPSRMVYCHVLHRASEKAAEVLGVSVEILMRFGTKIHRLCLTQHAIPAMHVGKKFPVLQSASFLLAYPQAILCQSAQCLGMFLDIHNLYREALRVPSAHENVLL